MFGVVLALALHQGHDVVGAAAIAARAAARVVEGPDLGSLPAAAHELAASLVIPENAGIQAKKPLHETPCHEHQSHRGQPI